MAETETHFYKEAGMCGVIAVVHFDSQRGVVGNYIQRGLSDLQHRGKEACGVQTEYGSLKGVGKVAEVLGRDAIKTIDGSVGLGHVLYSTSGKVAGEASIMQRAQPYHCRLGGKEDRDVFFAFNGNLVNWKELAAECRKEGYRGAIHNDTGVIAALIELAASSSLEKALQYEVLPRLKWSFSIVFYDRAERTLYAARDPLGFMPLYVGRRGSEFLAVASEDGVFAPGGLDCWVEREVQPGSIVRLDPKRARHEKIEKDDKHGDDGAIETISWFKSRVESKRCIFQTIYFIPPYGTYVGRSIKIAQENAGRRLAILHSHSREIDFVAPIRNSGLSAAAGYAWQAGIKFEPDALYPVETDRAFMEMDHLARTERVKRKFRIIPEVVRDKKFKLIDDSLVRGDTLRVLIEGLRNTGAREIHIGIASPPVKFPCVYGIDTPTLEELAWNRCGKSVEGVRAFIGADSLEYLDPIKENIEALIETPKREPYPYQPESDIRSFCTQCFTGENAVAELEELQSSA